MLARFRKSKGQKGFTLVEVIVVAVIVAVLAAVAIPLYTGYVKSSRSRVAQNIAGSVASFFTATRQADPTMLPASATHAGGAILNGADNTTFEIPADYSVTIDNGAGTVEAFYTADATLNSAAIRY